MHILVPHPGITRVLENLILYMIYDVCNRIIFNSPIKEETTSSYIILLYIKNSDMEYENFYRSIHSIFRLMNSIEKSNESIITLHVSFL